MNWIERQWDGVKWVLFIVLIIVMFVAIFWALIEDDISSDTARKICYDHGYAEAIRIQMLGGDWWCKRLVNGSDEIVPLCRLTGGCE